MNIEFKRQLVDGIFDLCEEVAVILRMDGVTDEEMLEDGYKKLAKWFGISKEDVIRIELEAKEFYQKD